MYELELIDYVIISSHSTLTDCKRQASALFKKLYNLDK